MRIQTKNPHLTTRDIERIVDTVFNSITDTLANGDRVELRGFGAFSVKARGGYLGRNPRTGENVDVAPKYVPSFKVGKQLREALAERAKS